MAMNQRMSSDFWVVKPPQELLRPGSAWSYESLGHRMVRLCQKTMVICQNTTGIKEWDELRVVNYNSYLKK